MTNTRTKRLTAQVIQADIDAYLALKVIPDYQPFNLDYSLGRVSELHERLLTTQEAELHAQHALLAARDAAVAAQSAFHDVILGVKNQVKAQYGVDSDQLVSVGLKKKSERKVAVRTPKAAARPDEPST
ncbi:hypothetical protein [Zoogloea sp.]|uniref:hypothetical protein n=1 Tax=Zoogloea sp. TaxID=49181 RepID=UPI001415DA11|nr:MAG: hypothetical protein F9K15_23665 [Zoogloea sp.]